MNLSDEQSQIVGLPIGQAIQVLASAGTGKTRVLTERIRHILENTKRDGIIALTFTNKAAEEMSARLEACEQAEDRTWIATTHAVAQRILESYGHTIGLPAELHIYERDKDRMAIFMQALREDGVDVDAYLDIGDTQELKSREKNLNKYMSIFSQIKKELWTESEVSSRYSPSNVWRIYQDYQSALLNSGGIDFDDILIHARDILLRNDQIGGIYRSRYKHICVDEAQDLNKAQYEFIKALCGNAIRSVFMVGDPNQMIYGFNGSSKDYLCQHFVDDFAAASYKLSKNFRSAKQVVAAANSLRPGSQAEVEYAFQGRRIVRAFDTEEAEAEYVTSTINSLLELGSHEEIEGDISLEKMVVIARNRFVFLKLEETLKSKPVPYYLKKGERQQEPSTTFGKVLDYALRVKLNPKDWVDGKKLCQTLGIGEPGAWVDGCLQVMEKEVSSALDSDGSGMKALQAKLLAEINELDIAEPNIPKLVRNFDSDLKSLADLRAGTSDDNLKEEVALSLGDLDVFSKAWTIFRRKDLGTSLTAFRNAGALGQLAEDTTQGGLTLSTVHTMKGLEKDIVFLIGMCEGVFPDYRATTPAKIEEERNSAFVAVTRAKRWLYLSYPRQRVMPWGDTKCHKKSRFIEEIEESVS